MGGEKEPIPGGVPPVKVRGYPTDEESATGADVKALATDYGSAVLVKGVIANAFARDLPDFPTNGDENFQLICADATLKGIDVRACSVKLPSGDPGEKARSEGAAKMASDFRDIATRTAGGKVVVLGGDFNARPHHPELNPLYKSNVLGAGRGPGSGYFVESDQTDRDYFAERNCASSPCRSGEHTHAFGSTGGSRRYDYVFFSDAGRYDNVHGPSGNVVDGGLPAGGGDHKMVTASAYVE